MGYFDRYLLSCLIIEMFCIISIVFEIRYLQYDDFKAFRFRVIAYPVFFSFFSAITIHTVLITLGICIVAILVRIYTTKREYKRITVKAKLDEVDDCTESYGTTGSTIIITGNNVSYSSDDTAVQSLTFTDEIGKEIHIIWNISEYHYTYVEQIKECVSSYGYLTYIQYTRKHQNKRVPDSRYSLVKFVTNGKTFKRAYKYLPKNPKFFNRMKRKPQ